MVQKLEKNQMKTKAFMMKKIKLYRKIIKGDKEGINRIRIFFNVDKKFNINDYLMLKC